MNTADVSIPSGNGARVSHIATHSRVSTFPRKLAFTLASLLVPAGAALLGSLRSRKAAAIAGGASAAVLLATRWQLQRFINPEPAFTVEGRIGELEIRRYKPMVEARVEVPGAFDTALDDGFRTLARYLFGNKLSMTSPVLAGTGQGLRRVAFIMPPGRTRASLPPPEGEVEIVDRVSRRIAVLPFSGRYNEATVAQVAQKLLAMVDNAGLIALGEPTFAGFDPPSTLPWLRRNEIWVELADVHGRRGEA